MKTIILVRHGESQTNLDKKFAGQMNTPLTERGLAQAAKMAEFLDQYKVDRIYASSLDRAAQTAQAIGARQNCTVEKVKELWEMNAGVWQGMPYEEIAKVYPQSYDKWMHDIGQAAPEGGETCEEFYNRITAFFKRVLESEEETVCLVAHAIAIRMMQSYIQAGSVSVAQEIPWVPNASISIYRYDGKFHEVLIGHNDFLGDLQTRLPKSI